MLQLEYKVVDVPFRQEFVTSHGSKKEQRFLYVKLSYGPISGYGACPVISYSGESESDWLSALETKGQVIRNYAYNGPHRFWHFLHHLYPKLSYLVSALDLASWDLWGKMKQKPVHELLGYQENTSMPTDITYGIGDKTQLCSQLEAQEFRKIKLKWSDDDLESLFKVADCTKADLRVDLNEAWSLATTDSFLSSDTAARFEILEQPCAITETANFKALANPHGVLVIADESFQTLDNLADCAQRFHGINIKLPKCGGITPALDIINQARELNLSLLLGSMSEGVIGTASLIHISSAFDFLDLDGCLLLNDETATGVYYQDQVARVQKSPGLGVDVTW